MENRFARLKCNEFPEDSMELYKTRNGTLYIEVVDNEDIQQPQCCSVNVNPEDVYRFLADNYDLNELKEKAETK